jgi:hypothetical protein
VTREARVALSFRHRSRKWEIEAYERAEGSRAA